MWIDSRRAREALTRFRLPMQRLRQFLPAKKAAGLGLADQIVNSGQNFLVLVIVARSTSAEDFGAFSVAVTILMVAVGIEQACAGDPLLVAAPRLAPDIRRRTSSEAATFALLLGFGIAIPVCLTAPMVGSPLTSNLLAMAAVLPAFLLQDLLRLSLMASGRVLSALLIDSIWVLAWIPLVVVFHPRSAACHLVIWGWEP